MPHLGFKLRRNKWFYPKDTNYKGFDLKIMLSIPLEVICAVAKKIKIFKA